MLDGVRVLDLTQFLSGPFGSQMLADLGAEVIKIEPRGGDSSRAIPPHFVRGDSAYFHAVNRGKKSVQIDLKSPAGRAVFLELVRTADVVFDNFRPGVLERLQLDHAQLERVNPKIITCSVTGFGEHGQYRDRPAYDAIVQAMSGGMSLTGHAGAPPARMGIPIGDLSAGMYAATAIAASLVRLHRTGAGDHIEIAMLDCQLAMLTYQAAYYLFSGAVPGPQGSGHVSIPTYRSFRCADDRYVMVTANTEAMWRSLCAAIGVAELADDPRFVDAGARLRNQVELWVRLEPAFRELPAEEALARLVNAGVPAAPMNTVADALDDANTADREMLLELISAEGAVVMVSGNPIKSTRGGCRGPHDHQFPPRLGGQTAEVLADLLGYEAAHIERLRRQGAVGAFESDTPSKGLAN
ncbi:CaiB/BaiF CoA transferase family protein [Dactylosporangium fulvum]|uniref:CoA transferase n=1 Tax=Dactylosporangium fulvum TaxID=53359 RepID=A0ABY5WAB1_9ACTN|nr:CoA transferase [Dactylosporangium fulvum]UWP86792.1 CoA transferase [Dactylosporangium fulvum]